MKWKDKKDFPHPIPEDDVKEMERIRKEFFSQEFNKEKVRGIVTNIITRFDFFDEFIIIDEDTLTKVLIKTNGEHSSLEHAYEDVICPGFYIEATGSIKNMRDEFLKTREEEKQEWMKIIENEKNPNPNWEKEFELDTQKELKEYGNISVMYAHEVKRLDNNLYDFNDVRKEKVLLKKDCFVDYKTSEFVSWFIGGTYADFGVKKLKE